MPQWRLVSVNSQRVYQRRRPTSVYYAAGVMLMLKGARENIIARTHMWGRMCICARSWPLVTRPPTLAPTQEHSRAAKTRRSPGGSFQLEIAPSSASLSLIVHTISECCVVSALSAHAHLFKSRERGLGSKGDECCSTFVEIILGSYAMLGELQVNRNLRKIELSFSTMIYHFFI